MVSTIPNPIDVMVGQRLRLARLGAGMSQTKIGDAAGVTFQQVQKYEKGANRLSASRLVEFSRVLGVSVSYFFEEIEANDEVGPTTISIVPARVDIDLARRLAGIESVKIKRAVIGILDCFES